MRQWLMYGALAVVVMSPTASRAEEAPSWELTVEEKAQAKSLVEKTNALESYAAEDRLYYIDAELYRIKGAPHRHAQVIHYRYKGDLTLYTRIDLEDNAVVGVEAVAHEPTRLGVEEFEIAKKLVLADPEVRKALGDDLKDVVLEPMAIRTFVDGDPLRHHRIFRMLFKQGRDYLRSPLVAVDLTTRQIIFEGQRKQMAAPGGDAEAKENLR